jgi:predicted enzyme related to lactoylglutathione lyase
MTAMIDLDAGAGQFCWVDLAASDAGRAQAFYGSLFGWTAQEQRANGGSFTRLRLAQRDIGSMYQLHQRQREQGVPSHWTPYLRVADADETARRAAELGGRVIVPAFAVSNIARIALIQDAVGAHVGLWETIATGDVRG